MSTDSQSGAAPAAAPTDESPPFKQRRLDRIDQPARPLGDKRAALQRLRQRATRPGKPTATAGANRGPTEIRLASQVGNVSFALRATAKGLLIERKGRQPDGACLMQTMVLANTALFDRWCACEPARFDDPALFDQLVREGHDALGAQR